MGVASEKVVGFADLKRRRAVGSLRREDGRVGPARSDAPGSRPSYLRIVERSSREARQDDGAAPEGAFAGASSGLEAALDGALARAGLHEVHAVAPPDGAAAAGFAVAVLARRLARSEGTVLWVEHDRASREAGRLYGPGLVQLGFDPGCLLLASVRKPVDALWAMEEGLCCDALLAVVGEIEAPHGLDLTATRRLALRARERGSMALLLNHGAESGPSAALTRWRVRARPSAPLLDDRGLGHAAFEVALMRNRFGPCGRWMVEWDPHARVFRSTSALTVAASSGDRSARTATGPG